MFCILFSCFQYHLICIYFQITVDDTLLHLDMDFGWDFFWVYSLISIIVNIIDSKYLHNNMLNHITKK